MARTPAEIKLLLDRARDLYDRGIPRIAKTVELHAQAFAFGGLQRISGPDPLEIRPVNVEVELLLDVATELYIAGEATVDVEVENGELAIKPGTKVTIRDGEISYAEHGQPGGHLWRLAVNYDAITSPVYPQLGYDLLSPPMLLPQLLDPQSAANVPGDWLANELGVFLMNVEMTREHFGWAVEKAAQSILPDTIDVRWGYKVRPAVDGQNGMLGMGHVYQIFNDCGIPLARLRADVGAYLDLAEKARLMSKATAGEILASFDEPV